VRANIYTTDHDFPGSNRACAFLGLWLHMLNENWREVKYTADTAKVTFGFEQRKRYFALALNCFN